MGNCGGKILFMIWSGALIPWALFPQMILLWCRLQDLRYLRHIHIHEFIDCINYFFGCSHASRVFATHCFVSIVASKMSNFYFFPTYIFVSVTHFFSIYLPVWLLIRMYVIFICLFDSFYVCMSSIFVCLTPSTYPLYIFVSVTHFSPFVCLTPSTYICTSSMLIYLTPSTYTCTYIISVCLFDSFYVCTSSLFVCSSLSTVWILCLTISSPYLLPSITFAVFLRSHIFRPTYTC
jgi:hypothetical protein